MVAIVTIVTIVYIPSNTNVSSALKHQLLISRQLREHPAGVHIAAGVFNNVRP